MVALIGETAGKVWNYLKENPGATLEEMRKSLRLQERLLCMAVGWLARENKLAFKREGKGTKLSLTG